MAAQDTTYVCINCGELFTSGINLRSHLAAESDAVSPEKNPELPESSLVASPSTVPEKPELSVPCRFCKKSVPSARNKSKKIEISDSGASTTSGAESRYKCTECERSFSSFQALGGHRGIHNKNKKISDNGASTSSRAESVYNCGECERSFSSFQALGGHRSRTHNEDLNKNKKLKIKVKNSGTLKTTCRISEESEVLECKINGNATLESRSGITEGSEVSVARRRFDFDLNEPPCDDMEDDVIA